MMMPCICVICFFLLLVWFVKSWPDRERERDHRFGGHTCSQSFGDKDSLSQLGLL
jgi:hypothetical protein